MLSLEVPKEYMDFIDKHGIISKNGIEIYGLIDNIDNNLLPSVIAATKLYKEDYKLKDDEIVITFDDFLNCPVVLDNDNVVYNVYLDKREKSLFLAAAWIFSVSIILVLYTNQAFPRADPLFIKANC